MLAVGMATTAFAQSRTVTANPPTESTVSELSVITLTSDDPDYPLIEINTASAVTVTRDETIDCGGVTVDNYADPITLTLKNPQTEPGTYYIQIPRDALDFFSEDYSDMVNGMDVILVYTIDGTSTPTTYTVNSTPESGSTLTEPFSSVEISSGEPQFPDIDILSTSSITVTRDGSDFCGVTKADTADGVRLTLKEAITESGEYVIHLPKDSWEMYMSTDDTYDSRSFDLDLTYIVDLPGVKYNIEILPTRITPNSETEPVDLAGSYDGSLTEIRFQVNGQLYLNPDAEATKASLVCKKNKYDVSKALRADEPKSSFGGYRTTFYLDLDPALVQDGTYTLTIPRGAFGDSEFKENQELGSANREFTLDIEFTGGEPAPEPTVVYDLGIKGTKPAEGIVDMSGFTWEVTQISVPIEYKQREGAEVTLSNEVTGYSQTGELRNGMSMGNTNTMLSTNGKEPNKNGTYILTIPAGSFGDEEWLADPETGHTNPEIKVYYRVTGAEGTDAALDLTLLSAVPAENGTADISDEPLSISFTAAGELSYYPNSKIQVYCDGAEYDGTAVITGATTEDGNTTFTTTLSEPILVNGTYTVAMPEGIFGDLDYVKDCSTGHGNEVIVYTFEVTGGQGQKEPTQYDLMPTVTPADNSEVLPGDLDVITFVFPTGTRTTSDTARASMSCPEANYFDTAMFIRSDVDGTYLLKYGSKPKRDGVYTIKVVQGTFADADDEHENPEFTLTYTFKTSGIDSILTDEEAAAGIYDLNGVYVGDSTENLPVGVYVVKGRKVVKK